MNSTFIDKKPKLKKGARVKLPPLMLEATAPLIEPTLPPHPFLPIAHLPNAEAELCSLLHRAATATPEIDAAFVRDFVSWVKKNYRKLFEVKHINSRSHAEYIRRSNARPSVKKKLVRVWKIMCRKRITEWTRFTDKEVRKHTKRATFIKVENELLHANGVVVEKAPRLIQGAQPEFINIVGPWIMSLQDFFKRKYGGADENLLIASGLTSDKIAEWMNSMHGAVLENDISKFDSSICYELMELEAWIFNLYSPPDAVKQLIQGNLNARGSTHGGIEYFIPGTRKSGDPYTSLGNSLLNLLMHVFIVSESRKISAIKAKHSIKMVAAGDDNVSKCIYPNIPWKDSFLRLGFKADCIPRVGLEDAEFCSNLFVRQDDKLYMCPKPGRVLAKLGCFRNLPKTVTKEQAIRGTVLGLYNSLSFIPAMKRLFDQILDRTSGLRAWSSRKQDWDVLRHAPIPESCSQAVYRRYFGKLDNILQGKRWSSSALRYMQIDVGVPFGFQL